MSEDTSEQQHGHRSPGLWPIGTDGEGYPLYEQTDLDQRLADLIEDFRARGIGLANRDAIAVADAIGAMTQPQYLDLCEDVMLLLRDLYSRARCRAAFLAGTEFQCDFCGDILRTTMAGEHFATRHDTKAAK